MMDINPAAGILAGAAGAQQAQRTGSDSEQQTQATTNQSREAAAAAKAEAAADVGATEAEDQSAHERDADGVRIRERIDQKKKGDETEDSQEPLAKDPTGQSGRQLDFTA